MRIWACLVLASVPLPAQWTLDYVVQRAGERYAGVQVSIEQASAAVSALQQARLAYLPRGDFFGQVNRATRNNVYGMMLPVQAFAPISGQALNSNSGNNVFGTAVGFLVHWEPFDLGQKKARLATVDADRRRAERNVARTRFEVEAAAADAFLTTLAADEMAKRARIGADRALSIEKVVEAQVKAGLRPGGDLSRAVVERTAAEAQVIQAEQAARLARVAVVQFTGGNWEEVKPQARFTVRTPGLLDVGRDIALHPAMKEQSQALRASELRKHEADIAWRPHFNAQGTLYARGVSAGPDIYNWGLGLSVLFPFLDLPAIHAKQAEENHRMRAESAQLRKLESDLNAELERAKAAADAAIRMAATTPVQLDAAQAANADAVARYQAGLTNMADVADAQRLLLQAEIDDGLARLSLWRAHLSVAVASGDLAPFLEKTKQ